VRAAAGPVRYEVERAGRRLTVELAPRPLSWIRLIDRFAFTRRLTTTIEASMHVRTARLLVDGLPHDVIAALEIVPGALSRSQVAADPRLAEAGGAALGAYQALGAEVVVLLRFQARLRALLVLGAKRSEVAYTGEDLEMLEALADQAAVAVANAEAHRQVLEYAEQLAALPAAVGPARSPPRGRLDGRGTPR
jgi:GAF domain-containing protein